MKHIINNLKGKTAAAIALSMAVIGHAVAQTTTPTVDLTKDQSNGKKFSDLANNVTGAVQTGVSASIQIACFVGYLIVAWSMYQLWKASKDEREKPMSAIVGMFIGGAMAGITTIMWMFKNTVTG